MELRTKEIHMRNMKNRNTNIKKRKYEKYRFVKLENLANF